MKKKHLARWIFLFLWTSISWGQNISEKDSLEIMKKVNTVFDLFEKPDFKHFKKISAEKIYCIICFDRPDFKEEPNMLDRKEFFDDYLNQIKQSPNFIRATKSKNIILIRENDHRNNITVFFTIFQQDELAPGHEGGQFGIYFKKVNREFKFAGMETVP